MRRSWNGPAFGVAAVSLIASLGLAVPARANEDSLRQKVLEFNKITGADPRAANTRSCSTTPERTKKLLEAARNLAKEKDQPLSYHTAYMLAQVAAEMKDIPTSEVFYRVCMDQAAKFDELPQDHSVLRRANRHALRQQEVRRKRLRLPRASRAENRRRQARQYIILVTGRFDEPEFEELDAFDIGKRLRPEIYRLLIQAICQAGQVRPGPQARR